MTIYLKQNTGSQEILIGPMLSSSDGITPKTDLTIANTDIIIWKCNGTTLTTKHTGGATHISGGFYHGTLDADDTDTLGSMIIEVNLSGALMWRGEFLVLGSNVYNSLIGYEDFLQTDTYQWRGENAHVVGTNGVPIVELHDPSGVTIGTVTTATNVTNVNGIANNVITAASIADNAIDLATFAADCKTGSALKANVETVTGNAITAAAIADGAIDLATFAADCKTGSALKANVETVTTGAITAAAIADAAIDLATFAADCKTGSALKANVETVTTDAITAAAIKDDAVTKIQNGLATPTNITAGTITTVTNLTNLPAVTNDWLTAAGVKADAVTKIQNGLATPTNITAGTITTATNVTNLPAMSADWISAAGVSDAAVTKIQNGLATPTNITAGTITTVTNLTNLPATAATAAELAKVPKSDSTVSWNATALNAIQGECTDALNAYDPPTNAEMEARTLVAASYFDPAADTVARVTLVDTCTTNTDMRGTNSAALASVCTEARLSELDAANLPADIATVDAAVDLIYPFTYRHYKITSPVFDANHNMTSCTITRYPTKADKVADTNGKVYDVVATYDVNGDLATYSEEGAV